MQSNLIQLNTVSRAALVKQGCRREYFTMAYNSLEALIAIAAGKVAGSIAHVGFRFDSVIEVTSGAALLWRTRADIDKGRRAHAEKLALRIVGTCFVVLAIFVAYDSVVSLLRCEIPEEGLPGIILAALSLLMMPLLARGKRKIAQGIKSAALEPMQNRPSFARI